MQSAKKHCRTLWVNIRNAIFLTLPLFLYQMLFEALTNILVACWQFENCKEADAFITIFPDTIFFIFIAL